MLNSLRKAALFAAAAAVAAPAIAAPTSVSNGPVQAKAEIRKPLTLVKVSNMDFGIISVQDTGLAILNNDGTFNCAPTLSCLGPATVAEYTVTGTNNQTVTITKPDVTLTNQSDNTATLTLVLNGHGPASVLLPNSGSTGINFKLGGEINIPAATKEGIYQGNLNVTVNY
jgi:Domain of unknown function (DUF4402)